MAHPYLCYVLSSCKKPDSTYIGITNNFKRRLRQHNGHIKGGARYTSKTTLRPWKPLFQVCGFTEHTHSLQFEWAMKKRRKGARRTGKCKTLEYLLSLGKWTKRAPHLSTMNLRIRMFMTRKQYCLWAKISLEEFTRRRQLQGSNVQWEFNVNNTDFV